MSSETEEPITVNLEIEERMIRCNRNDLIKNSDYFKAMFEGSFAESTKSHIKLKDVNFEAMQIILRLLWDREYTIGSEQILPVLQTASMLQFLEIRDICTASLTETLSVENCLQIWFFTEQMVITPLCLKAKLMALMEFEQVKELDNFLELTPAQVCSYLGCVNLQANSEISVFNAAMKWYNNSAKDDNVLIQLLLCLDYINLQPNDYREISSHRFVQPNENCAHLVTDLQAQISNGIEVSLGHLRFMVKCRARNAKGVPCLLICKWKTKDLPTKYTSMYYYDGYKRRRKQLLVDFVYHNTFSMVYFENWRNEGGRKVQEIFSTNCLDLHGFAVIGWYHYIFVFGGEYYLGKGAWNFKVWKLNFLTNGITIESLPYPRRHFEVCICKDFLYVVGGTGPYGVIQDNMFWLDIKQNTWGPEIILPCGNRQIKCCNFNERLFILSLNNKNGYLYNLDTFQWSTYDIIDENHLVPPFSQTISIFSYDSKLFIKDNYLIELELSGDKLIVTKKIETNFCNDRLDSMLCNSMLYTLCKQKYEESDREKILIEKFDMVNGAILTEDLTETLVHSETETNRLNPASNGFYVFHYYLLDNDDTINQIVYF